MLSSCDRPVVFGRHNPPRTARTLDTILCFSWHWVWYHCTYTEHLKHKWNSSSATPGQKGHLFSARRSFLLHRFLWTLTSLLHNLNLTNAISKTLLSDAVKIMLWLKNELELAILNKTLSRINTGHSVLSDHIGKFLLKLSWKTILSRDTFGYPTLCNSDLTLEASSIYCSCQDSPAYDKFGLASAQDPSSTNETSTCLLWYSNWSVEGTDQTRHTPFCLVYGLPC